MRVTRRRFLQVSALAGGGFALGIALPDLGRASAAGDGGAELSAFLRIHADGRIVLVSPNVEMGQGVHTSHAMIVAEELDADLESFEAVHCPVDPVYNNPMFGMIGTGGSTSTPAFWMPLRQAGAAARAMLLAAAAKRWDVPLSELRTERGRVIAPDGSSIGYGELADDAAGQTPPSEPALKDPSEFKIVGKSTKRLEGPDKVTGRALFGIDLRLPGMLTAALVRPPLFGGSPRAVRNQDEVGRMPGVRKVKIVSTGVAVIADSYWQAKRACDRLDVQWDDGPHAGLSTEKRYEEYLKLAESPAAAAEVQGEAEARLRDGDGKKVEASFVMPYLAHAPMEPLNATAHVREGEADVWAGTYFQTIDQLNVAKLLGIEPANVRIHTLLAGGAFGRRATPSSDFLVEAVEVARGEGVPVKTIWAREDDIRGGMYRPIAVHKVEARIGANGLPDAWRQRVVTQSIAEGTPLAGFAIHDGVDHLSVEGASGAPYAIPHRRIELASPDKDVSILWWRSVGHTHTAFAGEHFLDIVAREAGKDPLEYRRALLADNEDERFLGVLNLAAEKAVWGRKLRSGRAHGIALRKSFSTYVCQIVECSMGDGGIPVVHKVTCAVDLGVAINPWNIEQQVQGAVAYGLTAALYGSIDFDEGRVRQSNFHDYRILRMHEMPEVDVHVVPSTAPPTGIGEPGLPPVAPAMANAKLALTGEPTYRLPFVRSGGSG